MRFINDPPFSGPMCWFIRPPKRSEIRALARYNKISVSTVWTKLQTRGVHGLMEHPDGYVVIGGGRVHAEEALRADMEDFYANLS